MLQLLVVVAQAAERGREVPVLPTGVFWFSEHLLASGARLVLLFLFVPEPKEPSLNFLLLQVESDGQTLQATGLGLGSSLKSSFRIQEGPEHRGASICTVAQFMHFLVLRAFLMI